MQVIGFLMKFCDAAPFPVSLFYGGLSIYWLRHRAVAPAAGLYAAEYLDAGATNFVRSTQAYSVPN
jgi:hypothetical protein